MADEQSFFLTSPRTHFKPNSMARLPGHMPSSFITNFEAHYSSYPYSMISLLEAGPALVKQGQANQPDEYLLQISGEFYPTSLWKSDTGLPDVARYPLDVSSPSARGHIGFRARLTVSENARYLIEVPGTFAPRADDKFDPDDHRVFFLIELTIVSSLEHEEEFFPPISEEQFNIGR